MTQFIVEKMIAIAGGLAAGVIVLLLSRRFGLEYTVPGALLATAFASAMLCSVRFTLK